MSWAGISWTEDFLVHVENQYPPEAKVLQWRNEKLTCVVAKPPVLTKPGPKMRS